MCFQRSSQRSTSSPGLAIDPGADVAGRPVAEEVVERLADHPQAELDGQLDQVGVAGGQPLAEGEGAGPRRGSAMAIGSSRTAKPGSTPASIACRRRIWPQNEWNVRSGPPPAPGGSAASGPGRRPGSSRARHSRRIRSRSSRAALFVNVRATTRPSGRARGLQGPEEPLGQHRRLAAAGPGAEGDAGPGHGQGPAPARRSVGGDPRRARSSVGLQGRPVGPGLARGRTSTTRQADGSRRTSGSPSSASRSGTPRPGAGRPGRGRSPSAGRDRPAQSAIFTLLKPSFGQAPVADVDRARARPSGRSAARPPGHRAGAARPGRPGRPSPGARAGLVVDHAEVGLAVLAGPGRSGRSCPGGGPRRRPRPIVRWGCELPRRGWPKRTSNRWGSGVSPSRPT